MYQEGALGNIGILHPTFSCYDSNVRRQCCISSSHLSMPSLCHTTGHCCQRVTWRVCDNPAERWVLSSANCKSRLKEHKFPLLTWAELWCHPVRGCQLSLLPEEALTQARTARGHCALHNAGKSLRNPIHDVPGSQGDQRALRADNRPFSRLPHSTRKQPHHIPAGEADRATLALERPRSG